MNLPHEMNFLNCSSLINPDFSDGFLSNFERQLYIGLPYPIHKPSRNTKIDIIRQFHTNQTLQSDQLSEVSEEFLSVKEAIMSQSFDESHVQIPKNLLDFCNTKCKLESAPFSCDYNPFYGSCLECFHLNNVDYLIRPHHRGTLRIINLTEPHKQSKLYLNTEDHSKRHVTAISHKDSFLLLRLGNEINLIEVSQLEDIQEVKWKKKLKTPILDAQYENGTLGLISANLKLRLYDTETNIKLDLGEDCNVGSVTRLDFIDSNNVGLLGQKDFRIIDLRAQCSKVFEPELKCVLCSMKIDNNTIYLASGNQLIHTDIRFLKNVEFCSHLMTKSPCYMDLITTNDSNRKLLCLANQTKEKVLFSGNSLIDSLPMFVPNICDTLTECQLTRDVLLKDQLDVRLDKSTFGIQLHCSNDEIFLYSANCLGDIFQQKISERSENNREAISNLEKWISELSFTKNKLHLTNLKNLSHLRFTLNKEPVHERLVHFRKSNKRAKLFLSHFQSVYNKNTVGNLVANFMAPWEEDDVEEREPVDLVPEVAPIEKVNSWIQSSYFFE